MSLVSGQDAAPERDTAAIFITDQGFLVPSLVAAGQLLDFGADKLADIHIFTINVEDDILSRLRRDFEKIRFVPLRDRSYLPADMSNFHSSHVPVASLARLVIADHLDPAYRNIVYLDGDIQVVGDPSALFTTPVPDGFICAAREAAWLNAIEGTVPYENIDALDLDAGTYFNAGVLAFSRETWLEMAPRALDFFLHHPEKCKVHDQTALNVVFKGKVLELSPHYNFHHVYFEANMHKHFAPRIIHFTAQYKPWSGFPYPWFGRFREPYADMLERFPYLGTHLRLSKKTSRAYLKARLRALLIAYGRARLMAGRRKAIRTYLEDGEFFIDVGAGSEG